MEFKCHSSPGLFHYSDVSLTSFVWRFFDFLVWFPYGLVFSVAESVLQRDHWPQDSAVSFPVTVVWPCYELFCNSFKG